METGLPIKIKGQTINVPTDWSNLTVKAWFDLSELKLDGLPVMEQAIQRFAAGCQCNADLVREMDTTLFLCLFETFTRLFTDELKPEPAPSFTHNGKTYQCQFLWAAQGVWDEIAWNQIGEGEERAKVTYLANHFWAPPKRTLMDRLKRRKSYQFKDELKYRTDSEKAIYQLDVRTFHNVLFFCSMSGKEYETSLKSLILRRCLTLMDDAAALQLKARFLRWRASWLIIAVAKSIEYLAGRFILTLHK